MSQECRSECRRNVERCHEMSRECRGVSWEPWNVAGCRGMSQCRQVYCLVHPCGVYDLDHRRASAKRGLKPYMTVQILAKFS